MTDQIPGHGIGEAEIRLWSYLQIPEALGPFDKIKHCDGRAAQIIAQCKRMIEDMSEYRQALAGRYKQLATMPSRRLKLERHARYYNKKIYYIRYYFSIRKQRAFITIHFDKPSVCVV